MRAWVIRVFGPSVRYRLVLLHVWQFALAVCWLAGWLR